MEREHIVSASVTNGAECICNPEILLGTNYGLWNFEKEVAPRGTLLDLNAAWELFLSRQGLLNVSFDEVYHHKHEVIDGVVYEDGDTTYTLVDDKGNKTNATFTIKANKGPVEHIEWLDGNLILYYTKTRPITEEDILSGVPIHYVYDESGLVVIDPDTGKPLIYDYVKIPIIEIFDNHETHKLFPWFADDQHTVRLRQNLDEDSNDHLGDFAVTKESEVFFAKERFPENVGNTLISLQSVYDLLKKDLGIEQTYENVTDIIDSEGGSIHQRANGSDILEKLNTCNKSTLVEAINENLQRTKLNTKLLSGKQIDCPISIDNILLFINPIPTTINNLLDALNWILENEIGDFINDLNFQSPSITEALNIIFKLANDNKDRIGFKNGTWIPLNTRNDQNLTDAINEVDEHTDELAKIIDVQEKLDPVTKKSYYENENLNTIIKNRLRPVGNNNNITIIEAINDELNLIGNLLNLTPDSKTNLVSSINEVDLHSDNNYLAIGANYNTTEGVKTGPITNLTTKSKDNLVDSINELNSNIGDLEELNTDSKDNLVNAINETISESPFVYYNTEDSDSGVVLKNSNNTSGHKSLVIGTNNSSSENSFISGSNNNSSGNFSVVFGESNISKKLYSFVTGKDNNNNGFYNLVNGSNNELIGDYNIVSGKENNINSSNSSVLGNNNIVKGSENIVLGNNLETKEITKGISIGDSNLLKDSNSIAIGNNNISNLNSTTVGINNEISGQEDFSIGKDNYIEGNNSYIYGEASTITGNNNFIIGKNLNILSNNSILIGTSQLTTRVNNSIIINGIETPHENSTHIGKDIYIQTHNSESKLLSIIFVDLNDWCKKNNSASLNGEKFLDTSHLVLALKVYLSREYTDNALIRFKMQNDNENGIIIVQGKSTRVYLNGSWYFTDNIENGWSRHEGEYLKVITERKVNPQGDTVLKHYLAFMDLLSTEAVVDTVGAQRSNTEDFKEIDLTHAYGAVDFDDIDSALDLTNRLKLKVDKTAQIITKYHNEDGTISEKSQNFIDPNNSGISANITLDLLDSFGINIGDYLLIKEKGIPGGYVPLNNGGIIDSKYLPSYVDDVIDVWAEYQIDDITGIISNIHLYEVNYTTDPISKGQEIILGETGKIYILVNELDNRSGGQFRWTGTQFTSIGLSNLVLGEVEGTAYEGSKGKAVSDKLEDHILSGTTTTPVLDESGNLKYDELGNPLWEVYKPNPHNVKPELLSLYIDDPNSPENINFDPHYSKEYNVADALQELFDRINSTEDTINSIATIIGTPEEIEDLDNLDNIKGNNSPSIIRVLLDSKDKIDSILTLSSETIEDLINTYFIL